MKPYANFRELERLSGVTWQDLVELEPRLGELLWRARLEGVSCRCWSDVDRVFSTIRNSIAELVGSAGRNHRHPVLGSTGAYEVAYWKLYDAVAWLLPSRAGAAGAVGMHRGEPVDETCPTEAAATASATG
jgi:hypothetical protein